jgi:hypothetical protein
MPPERITAKLLIVDAGPLITLAAAASLDYLLYANGAVIIPDAVFFEATRDGIARHNNHYARLPAHFGTDRPDQLGRRCL